MKTHEVIIINECRLPRGGTRFTYSVLQTFLRISFVSKVFRTFAVRMRKGLLLCHLCLCVLLLMMGCTGDGVQMRQQLEELEQQNRAGEQLLNDSLAEDLVEYFDRHGDANERMRAKYMLGRTYYHLGELPRALETYLEAADCADTTSADCNYKVLSRIHAQSAVILHHQIQPRSQLQELRLAERFAWMGKDTLQAIECYAQQAEVYDFLHLLDSVIIVRENAARLFTDFNREDRAAQTLGGAITALLKKADFVKAKKYKDLYETNSNLFDENGRIHSGREIYYYIKGSFYMAIHQLDSAEYMFRKELRDGKDLNNQIAGCKGLQELYEKKKISDSIAKYANLGYILNDSAYSLSEMQNIQKLRASYNYNHLKLLAQKKSFETKMVWLTSMFVVSLFIILLLLFFKRYRIFKHAALDHRLRNADITRRFHEMAKSQPAQYPSLQDWNDLRSLVEREIPSFRSLMNPDDEHPMTDLDYDVCVAIRVHLSPIEISRLKQCAPSYITKIRKHLLSYIFGKEGTGDDFDDEMGKIGH